jgi:hypothetical protein
MPYNPATGKFVESQNIVLNPGQTSCTILVGYGQLHSSFVFLNGRLLAKGDIFGLNLGDAANLAGKTLHFQTVVTDVNPVTDMTSVSYIFASQGHPEVTITYNTKIPGGGTVIYDCTFKP